MVIVRILPLVILRVESTSAQGVGIHVSVLGSFVQHDLASCRKPVISHNQVLSQIGTLARFTIVCWTEDVRSGLAPQRILLLDPEKPVRGTCTDMRSFVSEHSSSLRSVHVVPLGVESYNVIDHISPSDTVVRILLAHVGDLQIHVLHPLEIGVDTGEVRVYSKAFGDTWWVRKVGVLLRMINVALESVELLANFLGSTLHSIMIFLVLRTPVIWLGYGNGKSAILRGDQPR